MLTLVAGAAASGKSEYAERLLLRRSGALPMVYLATMTPEGAEARARIERHRAARRGRGFATLECYVNLERAEPPPGCALLLEDVGNLCANELFWPGGAGEDAAEAILRGVAHLQSLCAELVLVTNEVFTGGAAYGTETLRYLSLLSYVNRKLAAEADAVCEVCCGTAEYYKGTEADV